MLTLDVLPRLLQKNTCALHGFLVDHNFLLLLRYAQRSTSLRNAVHDFWAGAQLSLGGVS
jgi:hypothetical protein